MRIGYLLVLLPCLLWAVPDTTSHFELIDSSRTRWAAVRLTLAESIQVTDLGASHMQSSTWARLVAFGELSPQWSWETQAKVFTDIANYTYPFHDYEPYHGIAFNIQDSTRRTWDYITTHTNYRLSSQTSFCAGLDYLRFGPAFRNPLSFRGEQSVYRPWMDSSRWVSQPAPMLYAGFDLGLSWIRYTQYSGELKHEKKLSKYFHTHRLTFSLPANSEITLQETEIYGSTVEAAGSNNNTGADSVGRNMEWLYAMPFVPYFFASHYIGDRDNGLMGMDGTYRGIPHWELYGELLLDDSKSPLSMFDDSYWGNKWAFTGGSRWHFQHGPWKGEWRTEFSQIEPWVYTHYMGASHQYSHYGQCIGSNLGPNSREIYTHAEIEWEPFKVRLAFAAVSKDTAFGSHIEDIHPPPPYPYC